MTTVNSSIEHPRFPDEISYGSQGGPGFETNVVAYGSGYEQRNPRWPIARHKYDAAHGIKDQTQLNVLVQFFHIAQGRAFTFRFKDWGDYQASSASNVSGTGQCNSAGVGTATPHYALYKKYGPLSGSVGSTPYALRRITKPVSGTITAYRNGAAVTVGTSPGQVSFDTTTGTLTYVADLTRAVSSISNSSKAILTLTASANIVNSTLIYIDSVAGMTQINSAVHYVNSVISPTQYMIGTDTRTSQGYGLYTGSGFVRQFPQAADVLTAVFEFDVPCRFQTDEMRTTLDAPGVYSWGQIPIWEVKQG